MKKLFISTFCSFISLSLTGMNINNELVQHMNLQGELFDQYLQQLALPEHERTQPLQQLSNQLQEENRRISLLLEFQRRELEIQRRELEDEHRRLVAGTPENSSIYKTLLYGTAVLTLASLIYDFYKEYKAKKRKSESKLNKQTK